MIRINLLPVRQIKAKFGRRKDLMIAGASLAVTAVLIAGLHLYQSHQRSNLEKELASLQAEIETLNVKVREVADVEKKIADLKGKLTIIEDLARRKVGPVRVMESLSAAVPPSVWLTEFRESAGSLALTGIAIDNQTLADFLKALDKFVYFKNVDLIESSQDDKSSPPAKSFKFSVRGQVLYQPLPSPPETKPGPSGVSQRQEQKKP
ncbi:MAG: PilN domain-containing protein [Deltaproteobacteria bacterium]|nr:PilN domain-containing protein [Deltaproteobacteria bacterium]